MVEQDRCLSVLRNASDGSITYYVGNDENDVNHLSNCTLMCNESFSPNLTNVELVKCDDPQLEFYKLSQQYKKNYLKDDELEFRNGYYLHKDAKIGENVDIGKGCVIGKVIIEDNVKIHPNVVIYTDTIIMSNSIIEANTVIGAEGVMWVWDNKERVYLHQLGGVIIEKNCKIGSNVTIVRGSANEDTIIGEGTCMAHGTLVGHGCMIGKNNHFANNVSLGGGVQVYDNCFFGSGVVLSAGCSIEDVILVGSGGVLNGKIEKSGVYVGVPAKWIKEYTGKMSGVPFKSS
ncbi:MAG: DapH/DapD/GlmU-related protein [Bacteroidota bacterium]|nr:DapH/DapD/GlmU-related protein [Bacteroidota bacterium]